MTKTCSQCAKPFEMEFDPKEIYHGDFCSADCQFIWLRDRGLIGNPSGGTGVNA